MSLSYYQEIRVSQQIRVAYLTLELCPKFWTYFYFTEVYRSWKRVIDLAQQSADAQSVINWPVVGQLS